MTINVCGRVYSTPDLSRSPVETRLSCTYLLDHDGPCSWQDVADAEAPPMQAVDARTAMDVASLVMRGDYDPYLELLLSAAHNRKRALRGVRGFPER